MNLVFLTSETPHHYYLVNEINKDFPVKKAFFQTKNKQTRTWKSRFIRWRKKENVIKSLNGIIDRILFGREQALEKQYERDKFFNGREPALDPSISSQKVTSFNEPGGVTLVKNESPDIIIVFGTDILKGEILNAAKLNILNIHRGIAPVYCGGSVTDWALYHNDFDQLGVTIHVCTNNLDAGDIVGQRSYRIQKEDKIYMLRYKTTVIAIEILKEILSRYHKHTVEYHKQSPTKIWTSKRMSITRKVIARNNLKKYIKKSF